MNDKRILYLFTRTPLHVGAGSSVGAIDQPIIRERHTGFPLIPASSLKGTFADAWNGELLEEGKPEDGKLRRVRVTKEGAATDAAWLFGSDSDKHAAAGALQFSEARLLAFPIRSARGSFAWITSPLILHRAVRDGALDAKVIKDLKEPSDEEGVFDTGKESKLALEGRLVLEEYTFRLVPVPWLGLSQLGDALARLLPDDPVWQEVSSRVVIVSNGMMSFFAQNTCEIAQHVRINDATGTAEPGALFNQENVPSETLFYSILNGFEERTANRGNAERRPANRALEVFQGKVGGRSFQFGGDASTGLGYCSVRIA